MDYKEIEERIKDRIHHEMKEILDISYDFSLFEMIDIMVKINNLTVHMKEPFMNSFKFVLFYHVRNLLKERIIQTILYQNMEMLHN